MIAQQSKADLDYDAMKEIAAREAAHRRSEGQRLGHYLRRGGILIPAELPDGRPVWITATHNGGVYDAAAVARWAWRGRLEYVDLGRALGIGSRIGVKLKEDDEDE